MEGTTFRTRYYVREQENTMPSSQRMGEEMPMRYYEGCPPSDGMPRRYYVRREASGSPHRPNEDDQFIWQQEQRDAEILRSAMEGGAPRYYAQAPAAAGRPMMQPSDGSPRCSSEQVAEALAQRILSDRDGAMQRLRAMENALEEQKREAEIVEESLQGDAHAMRQEYEEQLHFAEMMLADASRKNNALQQRVSQLESCLVRLMATSADAEGVKVPAEPEAESALGMTKTKEAIEKAVKEAASLPADERRKKLKALRLKWHPDKHEVLREMAEEVTKIINKCIEEMPEDDASEDTTVVAS